MPPSSLRTEIKADSPPDLPLELALTSWAVLYETLEQVRTASSLSEEVTGNILLGRLHILRGCGNLFGGEQGKSEYESGNVKVPGSDTLHPTPQEKTLVNRVSPILHLSLKECYILLRQYLLSEDSSHYAPSSSNDPFSEQFEAEFTKFIFVSQLSAVRCISALFRILEERNETVEFYSIAEDVVARIAESISPTLVFDSFLSLSARSVQQHTPLSLDHARHVFQLQLAVLNVLFIVLYQPPVPVTPKEIETIVKGFIDCDFGRQQANQRWAREDSESRVTLDQIQGLVILISVEVFDLEILVELAAQLEPEEIVLPENVEKTVLLSSTSTIESIYQYVISFPQHSPASSPLLLALAFALYVLPSTPEQNWQALVSKALEPRMACLEGLTEILGGPLGGNCVDANGVPVFGDANCLAHRGVVKALLFSLMSMVSPSYLPFNSLIELFKTIFRPGAQYMPSITSQFWELDFQHQLRRSALSMSGSRFPALLRPVSGVLRSLTGDNEGLTEVSEDSKKSGAEVFEYFSNLQTFTFVIPTSGPLATSGVFSISPPLSREEGVAVYQNTKRIILPGGTVMPVGTVGTVVSPPGVKPVVVRWTLENSGWRLVAEVLKNFASSLRPRSFNTRSRTAAQTAISTVPHDVFSSASSSTNGDIVLTLADLALEDADSDDTLLELFGLMRSTLNAAPAMTQIFVDHISATPDFDMIRTLFTILNASHSRLTVTTPKLFSAVLDLVRILMPAQPGAVWTSLRSSNLLTSKASEGAAISAVLEKERSSGTYPTTIVLLDLVNELAVEAQRSHFRADDDFLKVKTEVLSRAISLVHSEIWVGYEGWRYSSLKDRFTIGLKITTLYHEILLDSSINPLILERTSTPTSLELLPTFLLRTFVETPNPTTLAPLSSILGTGKTIIDSLWNSGRSFEVPSAEELIEATLRFCTLLLAMKRASGYEALVPLEQMFFDQSYSQMNNRRQSTKKEVIDVIAEYAVSSTSIPSIALAAFALLGTLCGSLGTVPSSRPSMIGHFEDASATTSAFIRLASDDTQPNLLRRAVWDLISAASATQPGWAALFLKNEVSITKISSSASSGSFSSGAIKAAQAAVSKWNDLWNADPALLASILRFLSVSWENLVDQKLLASLSSLNSFWEQLEAIAFRSQIIGGGEVKNGDVAKAAEAEWEHNFESGEEISKVSYQNLSRAYAIQLLALDISTSKPGQSTAGRLFKDLVKSGDSVLPSLTRRTFKFNCDPQLHQALDSELTILYPGFKLSSLRSMLPSEEREYGQDYLFDTSLVRQKLEGYRIPGDVENESIQYTVAAVAEVNYNWCIIDSEIVTLQAYKSLLDVALPLLSTPKSPERAASILKVLKVVLPVISGETRVGDVMLAGQVERMKILLSLLQGSPTLFTTSTPAIIDDFIGLLPSVQNLIVNEIFDPLDSLRGTYSIPFHRQVLQIVFVFLRQAADIASPISGVKINTKIQAQIEEFVQVSLRFLVYALSYLFSKVSIDVNSELEGELTSVVALFEQALRPELQIASAEWILLADEVGLFRGSLDAITFVGSVDTPSLSIIDSILSFHLSSSLIPQASIRLAILGIITAYTNTPIARLAQRGGIHTRGRSSANVLFGHDESHSAWLRMLAVVTSVIGSIGGDSQFVEGEVIPFAQLCGGQLSKTLTLRGNETITTPFLQEIESICALFLIITTSVAPASPTHAVPPIIRSFAELALLLIPHLKDLLSHPLNLWSSFEPVSEEERIAFDQEEKATTGFTSTDGFADPMKHPLLAAIQQKILLICRTTVVALNFATKSFTTLITVPENWSMDNVLVVCDDKAPLNQPATVGTLVELATLIVDFATRLPKTPNKLMSTRYLDMYREEVSSRCLNQLMESVSLLTVSQLALTVYLKVVFVRGRPERVVTGQSNLNSIIDRYKELASDLGSAMKAGGSKLKWGSNEKEMLSTLSLVVEKLL